MSCVFCCRTKASTKNLGITFHSFPKDNETRKAWRDACVSRGCTLSENTKSMQLCSVHFTLNDYEANKQVRTFLKKRVVPSCFWRKPYMHCIVCSDVGSADRNEYLHEFPEDSTVRKQWMNACRTNGFPVHCVYQQHRICSKHFPLHSFSANDERRKYLKLDAIPVVFPLPTIADSSAERSENVITELVDSNSSVVHTSPVVPCGDIPASPSTPSECVTCAKRRLPFTDEPVASASPESTAKIKIWRPARVGDLREEHFSSPTRAKRNFHLLFNKCKEYKSKLALYRTKTWRLQKRINDLETLLSDLTDKK